MVTAGSGYGYPKSTMGVSSGKWYFAEIKVDEW